LGGGLLGIFVNRGKRILFVRMSFQRKGRNVVELGRGKKIKVKGMDESYGVGGGQATGGGWWVRSGEGKGKEKGKVERKKGRKRSE
jgi:hypothetical protein